MTVQESEGSELSEDDELDGSDMEDDEDAPGNKVG